MGQQWLLSLQHGNVAAHIWFAGDYVLEVQRKLTGDPFTPPDLGAAEPVTRAGSGVSAPGS